MVRRDPRVLGHDTTRWTLADLLEELSWLRLHTLAGLWQLLERLRIHYKRGRSYVHSPDPFYTDKMDLVLFCQRRAQADPWRYAFLYLDEFTYYRQPTLACAYEAVGHVQPLARRSYRSNSWYRIVGALNGLTGQVHWQQHAKIGVRQLIQFYRSLRQAYPQAEEIYVVQDNWPVHFHPQVMAHLQPQEFPWPLPLSPSWRAMPPVAPAQDRLPIRVLCLPTYASWTNPIEKLWRWLNQRVLHLHRMSDDWPGLKQQVARFLDQFQGESRDLLRYVGLLPN